MIETIFYIPQEKPILGEAKSFTLRMDYWPKVGESIDFSVYLETGEKVVRSGTVKSVEHQISFHPDGGPPKTKRHILIA